jgi:tubulin polyglutamylase TTLL4
MRGRRLLTPPRNTTWHRVASLRYAHAHATHRFNESDVNSKWIIKPCASARGIGIRVVDRWADIPKTKRMLIQRYVRHPYLINESKFDLRIYVHVTSFDPLRVYICRDGLVRFATQKYSNKRVDTKNRFMHLTNYSVNKNSDDFVENDDVGVCQGHKWSLKALFQFWEKDSSIDTNAVWDSICDVVIKTLMASDGKINSHCKSFLNQRSTAHELFGFDVMLDRDLKAWLIEVNISPSLHSQSSLDRDIKGRLMRDVFNLAAFHVPPPADGDPDASAGEGEPKQAHASHPSDPASKCGRSRARMDVGNGRLTAEERAKHAFYTSKFGDVDNASILNGLTDDDIEVLMETESEYLRRGELQRIFPARGSSKYLK